MRYVFGEYVLDTACDELRRQGTPLALAPQAFKLLTYLLEHRDRTVTKEELFTQVWQSKYVADAALTTCMAAVRQALEDRSHQLIKTVHRRGYRFMARVREQVAAEAPVVPDTPPPAAGPSPNEAEAVAERRHLTVLVCRLVSAGNGVRSLDPDETLLDVLADFQALCETVVRQFEGHIARYAGDQLVVYFGYPRAHEDDARRAVHTGVGIVVGMEALNERRKRDVGGRLSVRVGIHTGAVVLRGAPRGPLTLGETPTIAARVQDLAEPDTVVISQATLRLVEQEFLAEPLGVHLLEGLSQPLAVSRILPEHPVPGSGEPVVPRGLTPLVGREHELGLLLENWEQVQDGRGQVVLLSGEVGIGKSRLVQALHERLAEEPYIRIVWRCSSYYQQSAWYPVIAFLHRLLQLRREDAPAEQLGKLERVLEHSGLSRTEYVPLFADLLSLPPTDRYPPLALTPQRQRQQTLDAVLAWLLKEAERQPVCLVVEDLHWADPSTLECLDRLIDHIPAARLLLVLLFRPEFRPPWPLRPRLTQMALAHLSPRQVEQMVERMVGDTPLPAEVLEYIVAKTDGVPLFVEELTKMVLESGLIKAEAGQYTLVDPLPTLAIPVTLHDSLMARLDRLGAAKQVAQLGATIGKEFSYELIQAVAPVEEAVLQQRLVQLVAAELLYQRGLPPQARYQFKHTLIQEVAYQSLLRSTRRQYHQKIVQVMASRFPEMIITQPEVLAYHALHGEEWAQAGAYYRQAGAKAADRAAFREAVTCFEQALVALRHLPEDRSTQELAVDLRLDLVAVLNPLGEYAQFLTQLREAEPLARALQDRTRLGGVLARLAHVLRMRAELAGALAAGQQALALAVELDDGVLQAVASHRLGQAYAVSGEYRRAAELLGKTIVALEPGSLYGIYARAWLALVLSRLGDFIEGQRYGEEARRLAAIANRADTPIVAHGCLGLLYLAQGALAPAIEVLAQGLAFCRATNDKDWARPIVGGLGYAYALTGRLAEGRVLLEEAIREGLRTGALYDHAVWVAHLSEVCRLAGHRHEAEQHARAALELARQHRERGNEAWALWQLGTVQAQAAPLESVHVEAYYRQALALADELGLRPLQAHCHRSLGAVYARSGKAEQARAALATAIEMYRAMDMTFWLPQAEAISTRVSTTAT